MAKKLMMALILGALVFVAAPLMASVKSIVIPRGSWGAKPMLGPGIPHKVRGIILHNEGFAQKPEVPAEAKLRRLQRYSQNPACLDEPPHHLGPGCKRMRNFWIDIPYHYYIASDGKVLEGRPVGLVGETNTNYDPTGYIQVVFEGNFDKERPTTAQLSAARVLLDELLFAHGWGAEVITVHKDHAATICPGKNLMAVLPGLKASLGNSLR